MSFKPFNPAFARITGSRPRLEVCLKHTAYPFAHEAGVYLPSKKQLFITSNRIQTEDGSQRIQISKISLDGKDGPVQEEITPGIPMANGGVNYKDGILFCSQGNMKKPSSLIFMKPDAPYECVTLLDSFYGREFNSINDVVVQSDGSIWFTDPIYGYEQKFRPRPQLPDQVYRFDPNTGSVRVMADGFGRPNGISLSPDEKIVYITDTDLIHGDGTVDKSRPSTIYAFDISLYDNEPFLINRRVFAMADDGAPDGIKCDLQGNVYSGCGDGINVWSPGGVLLGKILIPGGVSNFCFGDSGSILALNENKLWWITLAVSCRGSLLKL
ncbi:uncharacterized protein N7484_000777 [Penicillium longicatenatum]|uniref:uncharacterized protein n=1 Tax=Penicillium longicatenatum TaxID=1561947 RepID=UPI0025493FD7|nr:uncharacterized protein N7484_000777 [Penicillium longicatenatum]KAJ5657128.1 hypothetical protein N7484_000777 [Penicillium longicatenatum]